MFFLIHICRNIVGVAGKGSNSRINSPDRDKRLLGPFDTTAKLLSQLNLDRIAWPQRIERKFIL